MHFVVNRSKEMVRCWKIKGMKDVWHVSFVFHAVYTFHVLWQHLDKKNVVPLPSSTSSAAMGLLGLLGKGHKVNDVGVGWWLPKTEHLINIRDFSRILWMRVMCPIINRNKVSLTTFVVKMKNWGSKCTLWRSLKNL